MCLSYRIERLRARFLQWPRFAPIFSALVAGVVLTGCTSTLASLPWIGEPSGVPERPETPAAYPAVHDMPPPRDSKPLSEAERKELEAELIQLRERKGTSAKTPPEKRPASK
jgi:hypothetical protein